MVDKELFEYLKLTYDSREYRSKRGAILHTACQLDIPCRNCGEETTEETTVCSCCGETAPGIYSTCPNCGSRNYVYKQYGWMLGRSVAGAFLFGPLGLLAGGIGQSEAECVCLNCGQGWLPFSRHDGWKCKTRMFDVEKYQKYARALKNNVAMNSNSRSYGSVSARENKNTRNNNPTITVEPNSVGRTTDCLEVLQIFLSKPITFMDWKTRINIEKVYISDNDVYFERGADVLNISAASGRHIYLNSINKKISVTVERDKLIDEIIWGVSVLADSDLRKVDADRQYAVATKHINKMLSEHGFEHVYRIKIKKTGMMFFMDERTISLEKMVRQLYGQHNP